MSRDVAPPWILFCDKGKPIAILPAGRHGEVASVVGLSMETACAIVEAANLPYVRGEHAAMADVTKALQELNAALEEKRKAKP